MKADLHCQLHRLSDGAMRVDQIIPYAKRIGLDYIAISDHESTHSIPEAGKRLGYFMQVLSMMGYTGTPIGHLHNELFRAGGPHKFHTAIYGCKTVTDLHSCGGVVVLAHPGRIKLTM